MVGEGDKLHSFFPKKLWVSPWNCICNGLCPKILSWSLNHGLESEASRSFHSYSDDPASDPWRVTGLWDDTEAGIGRAVSKGREFSFLKVLKKNINTLCAFPVRITLLVLPCTGSLIPGNIFSARWTWKLLLILSRYQMTTVKKR